jgi:hypothetical protein
MSNCMSVPHGEGRLMAGELVEEVEEGVHSNGS